MRLTLEGVRLARQEFVLDATFDVETAALGIFGPSGSGKSTLLELIAGLQQPERGTISLEGRELTPLGPRERHVGYVPQDETLFPHMSVRANIAYGATAGSAEHIAELAGVLELARLLDRGVGALSGGERRRVALARALAMQPSIVLLDEPLAGLDRALRSRTLDLLKEVRSRFATPMILVSHERDDVAALCDRAVVIERGSVIATGSPAAVL